MLNPIKVYRDAGKAAAHARNQRDEARASHFATWHRKAKALESDANRIIADNAYREGYTEVRNVPEFKPFA